MHEFHPTPQELIDTVAGSVGSKGSPEQLALEAKEASNMEKYGAANWYDWNIANWGTKWDVGEEGSDVGYTEGDTTVGLSFDSAWSPPIQFYDKMEELGFTVKAYYYEPGMAFCGCYVDGGDEHYEITGNSEWVNANIPEHINEAMGIADSMMDWEDEG